VATAMTTRGRARATTGARATCSRDDKGGDNRGGRGGDCGNNFSPGGEHIDAFKRQLRYLKGTADHGLEYDVTCTSGTKLGVNGFYDAARADCLDIMRSALTYVFFFCGCPIPWLTKPPAVADFAKHAKKLV
jgi:hypothetical protein